MTGNKAVLRTDGIEDEKETMNSQKRIPVFHQIGCIAAWNIMLDAGGGGLQNGKPSHLNLAVTTQHQVKKRR